MRLRKISRTGIRAAKLSVQLRRQAAVFARDRCVCRYGDVRTLLPPFCARCRAFPATSHITRTPEATLVNVAYWRDMTSCDHIPIGAGGLSAATNLANGMLAL